ncbi:MAG: type II toxin-antitoxin system mRNA interferase toxin, RelE/StbE family [Akkermansiaceae bacterium]|nr:type II toxin-antitoxin system mRNA interferase toxin, RelE/StbE family [Akkermansiaceae bacterium]MDP4780279.1 type II toxin-antitoxin system mRNA interferase toxin, RelE/StbE family [Akkermansiaceae bacterium]MDP4846238.1 type II toxin-antitoxin system mRNA interferase toxin, RelE/StbE family [Akkermansiaceae bacterium]MDP4898407.1 type II toxin-antitoxin system mRNA interferase toxin, RelE/StbE family [Akkermansiaceae bacterium]MDP4996541.1 type II toxin-antitoxin system mRNA interferase 
MSWDYSFTDEALKNLRKVGAEGKRRIIGYFDSNITGCDDPRQFGKALKGDLGELWRYRTGHYRIAISRMKNSRFWSSVSGIGGMSMTEA